MVNDISIRHAAFPFLLLFTLAFSVFIAGCGPRNAGGGGGTGGGGSQPGGADPANDSARLSVFVSIPPQETFVARIGGDRVAVASLVAPGQDAHAFEPTPAQAARFSSSSLFFGIGFPFEDRIVEKLAGSNPALVFVDTSSSVPKRVMEEGHGHEANVHAAAGQEGEQEGGGDQHEGFDPHVWLSPDLVKIQGLAIRDALIAADPGGEEIYRKNYAAFASDLDSLDAEIAAILSGVRGETVYVYHPVLGYFTDRYGLFQEAIEIEGKEPTARELAAFMERIREEHAGMIFVQKEFSTRSAEAVAAETGAVVKTIDPLSGDYFGTMRRIAHDIKGDR